MKYLSQLIKEIIPVIIGILIALFINNWNEERKDRKYLTQIFSSIEKELAESLEDIKQVIPKQLASVDTLDAYINNPDYSIYDLMVKGDGIHSPTIRTNAWQSIANSKIELIEYDKLSTLSDIEDRKDNLENRVQLQMDFLFENIDVRDTRKKQMYKMVILDIVGAEQRFQESIEEILETGI